MHKDGVRSVDRIHPVSVKIVEFEKTFKECVHILARFIEAGGVIVIVLGILGSTTMFGLQVYRSRNMSVSYRSYRSNLGRAILLGLEILVGADIILTVSIDPSIRSATVLGMIVLIRTFLSFALEVEIKGSWPWQHARLKRRDSG